VSGQTTVASTGMTVLAVDDERPALDEISFLVRSCARVGEVVTAASSTEALRHLHQRHFDVVLLDIAMPGLDGLELASILGQFSSPPAVVFVTAHEEHALAAFEVNASDYLLKPVAQERLAAALDRVARAADGRSADTHDPAERDDLESLAVDLPGRTMMVGRTEVDWVESAGDYIRLHCSNGASHLVRLPLTTLEERWSPHGFARIHRSYLVSLHAVRELRADGAQTVVRIGERDLPVSRRHLRALRDRLVRGAR
jgi:DNA-binding LytR/AlgR family response regulator